MVSIHPSVVWTPCTLCISSCVWSACVYVFLDSSGLFLPILWASHRTHAARARLYPFIHSGSFARAPCESSRARDAGDGDVDLDARGRARVRS